MEILLDTNFAITCTKQKIDFFSLANEIVEDQISWTIPVEVLEELRKISTQKGEKVEDKKASALFLDMFESSLKDLFNVNLVNLIGPNTDDGIVNYCKKHPTAVLATLDKKLKSRVENKILTIKGTKFIKLV